MARSSSLILVGALVAVVAAQQAAAEAQGTDQWGKGSAMVTGAVAMPTHSGKGDVNVDVQCNDVCNDVCTPIPNKVCNEYPYQTQVCNKVPVQKTKQVCNRICTKTTTVTENINTQAQVVSSGKGKGGEVMVSTGKGRKLSAADKVDKVDKADGLPFLPLLAGKAMLAHKVMAGAVAAPMVMAAGAVSTGKGATAEASAAPQVDVQCNDVCNDVPYTEYTTQCNQVTQTKTKCDIVFQQKCDKVCKPNCKKVTTYTSVTTTAVGKGTAVPVVSMGKGH